MRIPGIRRAVHVDRGDDTVRRAIDDELRFHFEMTMRDLMTNGMSEDDARAEAGRRFGNVAVTRDRLATIGQARAGRARRGDWAAAFMQDLRYALRGVRLKPGFAAAVIVTLGLGIGANATMFEIVDRLLFRPPAFLTAPGRASMLYLMQVRRDGERASGAFGYRQYLDLREGTTSFDAMTPFYVANLAVGTGDDTRKMKVAAAAADLWRMFDARPVIGRFFTASENEPPTGRAVAVLSYGFWQAQYGGRATVVGSSIDIGPTKYAIIGVAPEGFTGFSTDPVIAFVPVSALSSAMIAASPGDPWYQWYDVRWFETFARRKPGVSAAVANDDLSRAFRSSYMKQLAANPKMLPLATANPRAFAGPVQRERGPNQGSDAKVASWLAGVAVIVLLIACANVANLLLARALSRRREIAVRIALGISRGRLLTQLVTESVLLAALGGIAGLAIAQWGGAVLRHTLLSDSVAGPGAFGDRRLLLVVAGLAVAAGLLTGLAPAVQARREDVASALKAGAREGRAHRSRLRRGLLVGQAALSVVLLVGAGLFVRSLVNVEGVRLGYDADRLLWVSPDLRSLQTDSAGRVALRQQLLDASKALPGVEQATRALAVPFMGTYAPSIFVPGIDSVGALGEFTLQAASPEFFQTMGTRILRGRGIARDDRALAPLVMVVSQAMAAKLWPGEDAVGKCVKLWRATDPCATVVGIAEDIRRGTFRRAELHYYVPAEQFEPTSGGLFIRVRGQAADRTDELRRALQRLMPGSSYLTVTPLSAIIAPHLRSWRLGATMFTAFGAIALVLAAVGLYGVIAYSAAQRSHEMGVRVALGAQSRDVISLIVGEGLAVVLPGVAIGTIASLVAGRWIAPLLFQVSPRDAPVLVSVIVTLVVVAAAASWLPALRASRVDPNEALRAD